MNISRSLFLVIIILFSNSIFAQNSSFYNNFGIETGVGQNTLNWSKYTGILTIGASNIDRNNLYLTSTYRIYYKICFYNHICFQPFLGYHKFGGKSSEDQYTFNALEIGLLPQFNYKNISCGIGYKINKIFKARYYYNESVLNRSSWFTDYSQNIGLRASYLFNEINISAETWFGFEDLSSGPTKGGKIFENHFRLLLGYTF